MQNNDKLIYIIDMSDDMDSPTILLLENAGFIVNMFKKADDFFNEFNLKPCDFIIINVEIPDSNMFTLCSKIRLHSTVPIILISSLSSYVDNITAINVGCDDYISKPFSSIELLTKISSIFRRINFENEDITESPYIFGDLEINLKRHEVRYESNLIHLTSKEFNVLSYLVEHKDRIVSRDEMLTNIWGFTYEPVETRAIDDCIKRLRKKLSVSGASVVVETVRGYGFKVTM
ncbi:MAG: response regulator transcription factor [Proteocatella sp.]